MPNVRETILGICRASWLKVARVISDTHQELALPDDDASYDLIALELVNLVDQGELEAAGDLSDWRHSEVRRSVG